jgi:hypothetical protein
MKLKTRLTYICLECGYNTTNFHHMPCSKCGSNKQFKSRIIVKHLSWKRSYCEELKFPYLHIRKEIKAPPACCWGSYRDLAEVYREFRRLEVASKRNTGLSPHYRKSCKGILKLLREEADEFKK